MMQAIARQPDAARALGMAAGLAGTWGRYDRVELATETQMSDRLAVVSACSRTMRIIVQSAVLGFGAWLVIRQELSPGVMIGASIIMGRALAPIELAAANWQKLGEAKGAFGRLRALLPQLASRGEGIIATRPAGHIVVSNVFAMPRKSAPAVLSGISFEVKPGQTLGIAGPAAAGKSTLARLLVGALAPVSGSVRLDGIELDRPDPAGAGAIAGLPAADARALAGNRRAEHQPLSRGRNEPRIFRQPPSSQGFTTRVLRLPEGYETEVGSGTEQLSVGRATAHRTRQSAVRESGRFSFSMHRRRISIPTDRRVLEEVLKQARANGQTVVVVSHNPRILRHMDHVLLLSEGRVQRLSSREEFFSAAFQALPKSRAQD